MELTHPKIHGHEVLEMMMAHGAPYSIISLEKAINEQFGEHARFHTCSAEDLSASQLINLLWEMGKFKGTPSAFTFDPSTKCDH
ncbi:YecH family metal-binding protein [Coraliomargarita akajimensis]|nr:YecH family metal-binding protein [Coraliomargarita akajimensis]